MIRKNIPVYNIDDFKRFESGKDVYANTLSEHLAKHHFIHVPHKHDFYISVLFTKGTGTHEIDFVTYDVKPGSVFFLSPGQMHNWKLSKNCEGYIFFHSAAFYDLQFASKKISDYPFFASVYNQPFLNVGQAQRSGITRLFHELLEEYKSSNSWMRHSKLCSLADLIYIELSRLYPLLPALKKINPGYLDKLSRLESLIATEFKTIKLPKEYAARMHMSEKHLNRICRGCLGKTTTDLISDRISIEAKRLLITSGLPVSRVAEELGYTDHAYFSRLFKKRSGQTPLEFSRLYKAL